MTNTYDTNQLVGADVYGADDSKIGTVGQVYLDYETGNPEWISVRTGLLGTKESFVPLSQATFSGGQVRVPYDKDRVKDAPRIDDDGELSQADEADLYAYYGLSSRGAAGYDTTTSGYDRTVTDDVSGREPVGRDTSGPTTDDAMTRSEERLNVGTRTEETGKARLRKYVVTEQQQVTVPVSREEVRVEREPITDANRDRAMAGPDISEEEHEVTLRAERPVVTTEAVPVERVRLDTETITEQETVTGEVRKEEVEVDDPTGSRTRRNYDR